MKLKNILIIFSIFFVILCISSVSASENISELSADDGNIALENENINEVDQKTNIVENTIAEQANSSADTTNTTTTTTTSTQQKTEKTEAYVMAINEFVKKSNKKFKVKIGTFDEAKNKLIFHKNVKFTVKIKIGKTTKTYNVKTNSKAVATVFSVKNLKVGTYKVTIASTDDKYSFKETGYINIYKKKTKTITLKMNKIKKVKGDYIDNFYLKKNGENKKGVYATSYNAKNPLDGLSHTLVMKAKFFFKNKKTGKIKTKTVSTKDNTYYLYKEMPYTKLIKGYTPIKTKIWYVTI